MNKHNKAALKIIRMGLKAFEDGDFQTAASLLQAGAVMFDNKEVEHLIARSWRREHDPARTFVVLGEVVRFLAEAEAAVSAETVTHEERMRHLARVVPL